MWETPRNLGQVVLVPHLICFLALPLVRQLHVVEAIEWGNAQNLAPEKHKVKTQVQQAHQIRQKSGHSTHPGVTSYEFSSSLKSAPPAAAAASAATRTTPRRLGAADAKSLPFPGKNHTKLPHPSTKSSKA
jgi:hypothetical protein